MSEFTASNGIKIRVTDDGYLVGSRPVGCGCQDDTTHATGSAEGIAALREYRDALIGHGMAMSELDDDTLTGMLADLVVIARSTIGGGR